MICLRSLLLCALFALPTGAEVEQAANDRLVDITGKVHKPTEDKAAKFVVFLYVSTDCPIANFYQPTIRRLAAKFQGRGIRFFQLHVDPDVTAKDAAKHAADFDLTVPVVLDSTQKWARRHGASVTPEAVVADLKGTILYRGRIDDTYTTYGKRRPEPTTRDLDAALEAALAGRKIAVPVTKAIGCQIFLDPK